MQTFRPINGLAYVARTDITLTDNYGTPIKLPGLDEVAIFVDIATGNRASLAWGDTYGKDFGDDIPLQLGLNVFTEMRKKSDGAIGSFKLKNHTAGADALVQSIEVYA